MPRAIVFKGDEIWELLEVPKPKLRPGCRILKVEAVGICHSDVDQLHGHPPVPSGGVFPAVPGHEIVGRFEEIALADRRVPGHDAVRVSLEVS